MKKKLFLLLFLSFALTSFNAYPLECVPAGPDDVTQAPEAIVQPEVISEALTAARAKVDEAKAEVERIKAEADQYYRDLVDQGYIRASTWLWTKWRFSKKLQKAEEELRKAEKECYRQQLIDSGSSRAGVVVRMLWKDNKSNLFVAIIGLCLSGVSFVLSYHDSGITYSKCQENGKIWLNFEGPLLQQQCLPELNTSIPLNSSVIVFDPNQIRCSRARNGDISCPYLGIVHIFPNLCPPDISDVDCDGKVKEKIVKLAGYGVFLPFETVDFHVCVDKRHGIVQCWKVPTNDVLIGARLYYNKDYKKVFIIMKFIPFEKIISLCKEAKHMWDVKNDQEFSSIVPYKTSLSNLILREFNTVLKDQRYAQVVNLWENADKVPNFIFLVSKLFEVFRFGSERRNLGTFYDSFKRYSLKDLGLTLGFSNSTFHAFGEYDSRDESKASVGFFYPFDKRDSLLISVEFIFSHEFAHLVQGALKLNFLRAEAFSNCVLYGRCEEDFMVMKYLTSNKEINADLIGFLASVEAGLISSSSIIDWLIVSLHEDRFYSQEHYCGELKRNIIKGLDLWYNNNNTLRRVNHPYSDIRKNFVSMFLKEYKQMIQDFDCHAELFSDPRIERVDE